MKTFLHRSFEGSTNDSQKMRCSGLSLFGIAILAFLTLSSCMMAPLTGNRVDKTLPVGFAGSVPTNPWIGPVPQYEITIQAYDPQGKIWGDIGKTLTSGVLPAKACGGLIPLLGWSTSLLIPNKYWAHDCASTGESALVRSKWSGGYLPSFTKDFYDCFSNHPCDFMLSCAPPESENVRVGSLNYRDFGKECADKINQIRKLEGKPDLQIDEAGECTADSNAQCNYEWEKDNCVAGNPMCTQPCYQCPQGFCCGHRCPGPGAQNECDFEGAAPSIDDILTTCIWQEMYLQEKACYQKKPPSTPCGVPMDGCYLDPNCMCGHYVNMVVCPNYTHVSCGLYITPTGGFKSVLNFTY